MAQDTSAGVSRNQAIVGAAYALLAYSSWGLLPLYWKLLAMVPPIQMVAHRVVWSVLVLAGLITLFQRWPAVQETLRSARRMQVLLSTTVLISANWLLFIWAVQNNRVVEASLGYFINPLVNIPLAMVFLGERLNRWQWLAVSVAVLGVGYQALQLGGVPWVGLGLALTFSAYGLLRKTAPVDGLVGLAVETFLLAPVALGCLVQQDWQGQGVFLRQGWGVDLLITLAGVVTALPLLWFANAARRLRYTTIGFFQYLSPSLALGLAVFAFGEPFTAVHLASFGCIWLALAIYTVDSSLGLNRARAAARAAVEDAV
ncbi:MAG TPA: EamA family transporter RarD [Candidatus Competibacteraceae bacterium]|nr:EamA family transporter RarD [Candidatus Competibacteraceae bacterium]